MSNAHLLDVFGADLNGTGKLALLAGFVIAVKEHCARWQPLDPERAHEYGKILRESFELINTIHDEGKSGARFTARLLGDLTEAKTFSPFYDTLKNVFAYLGNRTTRFRMVDEPIARGLDGHASLWRFREYKSYDERMRAAFPALADLMDRARAVRMADLESGDAGVLAVAEKAGDKAFPERDLHFAHQITSRPAMLAVIAVLVEMTYDPRFTVIPFPLKLTVVTAAAALAVIGTNKVRAQILHRRDQETVVSIVNDTLQWIKDGAKDHAALADEIKKEAQEMPFFRLFKLETRQLHDKTLFAHKRLRWDDFTNELKRRGLTKKDFAAPAP